MHQQQRAISADNLDYLQSMLKQLKTMADVEGLDMLAYLIDMAYIEASDTVRVQSPPKRGRRETLG